MHLFFTLFVALVRQCSATPTHSVCLSSKLVSQSHGTPWRKSWQGWLLKQQSWWVIFTLAKIHWKMRALPGILLAALATLASSAASLHVHIALFPVLEVASEDSSLRQPEPKRHTIADHPRKSRLSFQIGQKEEAKLGAGLIQDDLYHQEARWTIGLVTRMRTLEDYQVDNITGNFFWMNTLLDRKNGKIFES